jgi:hypothetical protein
MATITQELIREFFTAMRQIRNEDVVVRPRVPGAKELAARLRMSPGVETSGRLTAEEVQIIHKIIDEWRGEPFTVTARRLENAPVVVGQEVRPRPGVRVTDGRDEPIANAVVRFFVTGGGGIVKGSRKRTDADGVAEVDAWILGAIGGPNELTAIVGSTSVTFRARAVTPPEPTNAGQDQAVAGITVTARQVVVTGPVIHGLADVPGAREEARPVAAPIKDRLAPQAAAGRERRPRG